MNVNINIHSYDNPDDDNPYPNSLSVWCYRYIYLLNHLTLSVDADEKDNTLQLIDHILFMVKEHNLPVKIELLNHPFRLIGAIEKDLSGLLQVPQRERAYR